MKEGIMNEEEKLNLVEKIFGRIEDGHTLIDQVYCIDDYNEQELEEIMRDIEEFVK